MPPGDIFGNNYGREHKKPSHQVKYDMRLPPYKEILVKNDLYIQGTPWVPLPLIVYLTRILDARQINALTKRMVKILLNFEKENVFTLHQVGLNSTTLFCHK